MIIHDVEQGSADWYSVRLGIPTASNFHKIVTPTGKLSAQAREYCFLLVAEAVLHETTQSLAGVEWIERGKELEPDAVKMYEFERGVKTRTVGFITNDAGTIGASPDRLIIDGNGAVEIKCPAPQTHIAYMIDGFGNDYVPQVQGQMLVGGFDYIDRYSYHPAMPPACVRTPRDEDYIAKLVDALDQFNTMKAEMIERVRREGLFSERESLAAAHDVAYEQTRNILAC